MEGQCEHCHAKHPNLHFFEERSHGHHFQVVRCLLCGWQICRLVAVPGRWTVPGKTLPKDADELDEWDFVDVPDFVSESFKSPTAHTRMDY